MKNIYTFANHKGGTGKSTTVYNVGAGLARRKKKTLLVDLDPQCNLTVMHGFYDDLDNTLYDLFLGEININQSILKINKYLDLLPSSLDLAGAELELREDDNPQLSLKKHLEGVYDNYDYIILDAPPSMGLLAINALVASEKVFIPILSEFISLHGLNKFMQILEKVKVLNEGLEIGGVIATRYDKRKILNRGVVEKVREIFNTHVLKTVIRENVSVAESIASAQDIFTYAPKSNGAKDYNNLVKEILNLK